VQVDPNGAFNVIYSSGTTSTPKGIVQPHKMRWAHVRRGGDSGYGPDAVTMVSTPLYSNTTLVSFFPTVALGGAVVLMPKFDATKFLTLAQKHRATHAMLVPAQYQRIMDLPARRRGFAGSVVGWRHREGRPRSRCSLALAEQGLYDLFEKQL
jgi:long-chain acyl-CoA synthetase